MTNLSELTDGSTLNVSNIGRVSVLFCSPICFCYHCKSESLVAFDLKISLAKNGPITQTTWCCQLKKIKLLFVLMFLNLF